MSTVSRNCRNHGQRLQGGGMITPPSFGSRGPAPGILRSLLPLCCSNSRRTTSVRLCECEPRMASHVKSMGDYGSFKIPAKIAVSQGCYNPVEVPCFLPTKLRSPTGVFRPVFSTTLYSGRSQAGTFPSTFSPVSNLASNGAAVKGPHPSKSLCRQRTPLQRRGDDDAHPRRFSPGEAVAP
jgi:hypothetical protein